MWQHKHSPILKDAHAHTHVDWKRIFIVGTMLVFAIVTNVVINVRFPAAADHFPFIGVAVWVALALTVKVRRHDWEVLPETFKGSLFLLSLVVCASMMPVESLPVASWQTTLGLGFLSAVFDNIPLTALAIKQGGYDWGMLAYAVGFGGSMVWFGSSAGVALSNMYPEAKSAVKWVRHGWPVIIGYVVGFGLILSIVGWHPQPLARDVPAPAPSSGRIMR
jgi:Na+/H+ antiporter NhaD/arsenite permease-like protein